MPGWTIAAFTHRGRVRPDNEDAVAIGNRILTGDLDIPIVTVVPNNCCLLMIADGMGGHTHGAMASRALLDHLITDVDRLAAQATCDEAIREANDYLYGLMQSQPDASGMGTTLVGVVLTPLRLLNFNVGDSRAYLFTRGHLVQLSHDDVIDVGANPSGHRTSHAITQALGGSEYPVPINPHVNTDAPLASGETLLICSDGITDMVSDNIIRDVLSKNTDPNTAVRHLTAQAFRAGGHDNLSLIIARLTETSNSTN